MGVFSGAMNASPSRLRRLTHLGLGFGLLVLAAVVACADNDNNTEGQAKDAIGSPTCGSTGNTVTFRINTNQCERGLGLIEVKFSGAGAPSAFGTAEGSERNFTVRVAVPAGAETGPVTVQGCWNDEGDNENGTTSADKKFTSTSVFQVPCGADSGVATDGGTSGGGDGGTLPTKSGGYLYLNRDQLGARTTLRGFAEFYQAAEGAPQTAVDQYVKLKVDNYVRAYAAPGSCARRPSEPPGDPAGLPEPKDMGAAVDIAREGQPGTPLVSLKKLGATPIYSGSADVDPGSGNLTVHSPVATRAGSFLFGQVIPLDFEDAGGVQLSRTAATTVTGLPPSDEIFLEFGPNAACRATAADAAQGKITVTPEGAQLVDSAAGTAGNVTVGVVQIRQVPLDFGTPGFDFGLSAIIVSSGSRSYSF